MITYLIKRQGSTAAVQLQSQSMFNLIQPPILSRYNLLQKASESSDCYYSFNRFDAHLCWGTTILSYAVTHTSVQPEHELVIFPVKQNLIIALFGLLLQVVNTTSDEFSGVAIEASVWDLEGACPYYKVFDKLSVPPKKTVSIVEMKYPKSQSPKPVYFLLLKLYHMSDLGIISRNFYWLHVSGGNYKLLEAYRKKKVPLRITSMAYVRGSTYEIDMHVQNTSKKSNSQNLTHRNVCSTRHSGGDIDLASMDSDHPAKEVKCRCSLLQSVVKCFSKEANSPSVTIINGTDIGVAFFLHFSVHAMKADRKEGEDTRILPVHYSDNYFSLVPGEIMTIKISFEVPRGVTPRVTLNGWNYHGGHTVL